MNIKQIAERLQKRCQETFYFKIDLSNYLPQSRTPLVGLYRLSNNDSTSGFTILCNIDRDKDLIKLFYNCHSIDYHPIYLACKYLEIIPANIPFRSDCIHECADIIYFAHWREKKVLTILGDEPHISVSILTYDIKHNPNRG